MSRQSSPLRFDATSRGNRRCIVNGTTMHPERRAGVMPLEADHNGGNVYTHALVGRQSPSDGGVASDVAMAFFPAKDDSVYMLPI